MPRHNPERLTPASIVTYVLDKSAQRKFSAQQNYIKKNSNNKKKTKKTAEQLKAKKESYERMHKRAEEGGERTELLRAKISDSWVRDDSYRKSVWQSNLRLIVVFGVLLLVVLVFAGLADLGEFIQSMKNAG